MKKFILVCLVVLVSTGTAFAKDVCVDASGIQFVFRKVKKIKPGKAVPLTGIGVFGLTAAPVSGTAIGNSDGTATLGIQVFSMTPVAAVNFTALIVGANSDTFAGSGNFENEDDGGNNAPDGIINFTSIDCATVTIP